MSEQPEEQRQFLVQRIYTKDLSFESPNSPQLFQENWQPAINIGLNSETKKVGDDLFELVLHVSVEAKHEEKTAFLAEVHQAGLFAVKGFSEEEMAPVMGIAAPNVLFPYAREVISDMVTRGSFPQFVLQPVNFEALFAQQQQQASAATTEGDSGKAH